MLAERGRRTTLLWVTAAIALFGLVLAPMFAAGTLGALAMMALGLSLMGLTYGPLGTVLSELFPDASPLHRQLAGLQLRRHPRRIARALHRHLASHHVRPAICRLLPDSLSGADVRRPAPDARNKRRRPGRGAGRTADSTAGDGRTRIGKPSYPAVINAVRT